MFLTFQLAFICFVAFLVACKILALHFFWQADKIELHEIYDEIVNEMEEILLDSSESTGARFPQRNRMSQSQLSLPLRDGGLTASTSGPDDVFPLITQPLRIDRIEVVGAKQKKGDISLSERLVGMTVAE